VLRFTLLLPIALSGAPAANTAGVLTADTTGVLTADTAGVLTADTTGVLTADTAGVLTVFNAGSLAAPLRDVFKAFRDRYPEVDPRSESSGSVEAARKLTDLGKVPDVLAVADLAVLEQLVVPAHAAWGATFASNAMVIAYRPEAPGAKRISADNWPEVLSASGVRIGRSDPAQDPAGYRALMVFQLAERHYGVAGLERRLLANSGARYVRPKSVELIALLQTGNLDYALEYRTVAIHSGLPFLELPDAVNLADPELAQRYRLAKVSIARSRRSQDLTLDFEGEPIAYGISIPTRAPNPEAARAFVRFLLGPEGRAILSRNGFVVPKRVRIVGDAAAAAQVLPTP